MSLLFAKNNSLSAVTALPAAVSGGGLNLISTQTASSSATIDFTSGIDSTYKEYIFKFIDIHSSAGNNYMGFQANASGGSGFNETVTSTYFRSFHTENDSSASLSYDGGRDLAQGTGLIEIISDFNTDNDACGVGTLHIFDPSNTTFVKHFIARTTIYHYSAAARDMFVAGYINTTSAIDEIQFKLSSGNIDSGTFKLYGVT